MSKYIVKKCPYLMSSYYADGRISYNECGDSNIDEKCVDKEDCLFKRIASNLLEVIKDPTCSRCDGVGYDNGCTDTACGTYAAYKCLDLMNIEFQEN